jgi:hypothetical protein
MGAYQLVQCGEGITRASAPPIVRYALLGLTITVLAAAQTSQPSANFGSIPSGTATNEVLHLTLSNAINKAVRYNLGQIESGENARVARGQRLRALSALLPQVSAAASENVEQFSAATLGIKIPQVAVVLGPFSFSTAQANVSQTLFNFESIQRFRTANSAEQAAQLSYSSHFSIFCLPQFKLLTQTSLIHTVTRLLAGQVGPFGRFGCFFVACVRSYLHGLSMSLIAGRIGQRKRRTAGYRLERLRGSPPMCFHWQSRNSAIGTRTCRYKYLTESRCDRKTLRGEQARLRRRHL